MGSELGGPAKKSPRTRRRPVDSGILYVALGSWDLRSTANPVVSCQAKSQSYRERAGAHRVAYPTENRRPIQSSALGRWRWEGVQQNIREREECETYLTNIIAPGISELLVSSQFYTKITLPCSLWRGVSAEAASNIYTTCFKLLVRCVSQESHTLPRSTLTPHGGAGMGAILLSLGSLGPSAFVNVRATCCVYMKMIRAKRGLCPPALLLVSF